MKATVFLNIVVGRDVRVSGIKVIRSAGMGLDERPVNTVKTWRFQPAMRDGQKIEWQSVSRVQLICWTVFYGLLLLYLALNWGQMTLLDNIHLPIHEGGHLLFGWLGETLGLWGGTLLQLLVPALLAVSLPCGANFPAQRSARLPFSTASPGVATYMADALRLELPLVTVGAIADESQHDWVRIFTSLGLLPHAIQIGNFTRLVAWAGMIGSVAWFAWRGYRGGVASVEP